MNVIAGSVVYFLIVIALAHGFTPPEYHWSRNTISDLAAQGLKYRWIMQAGFIGFGLLLNLGFLLKFIARGTVFYPDLLLMCYGSAVLLTGCYSTAPFSAGVNFSALESQRHSWLATLAGVCFTAGIGARFAVAATSAERWQHGIFLFLVTAVSLAFGLAANGKIPLGKGLFQRLLYLVSFAWLLLSQS